MTFDYLYRENRSTLMTIGLHPRFSGHPGRCGAIRQFIEYILQFPDIWLTRRVDIARHWLASPGLQPNPPDSVNQRK